MDLKKIQPSQLFINSDKLHNILEWFNPSDWSAVEGIPVKQLNDRIIFTDGHTRAYAAHLKGISYIKVYWDEDDLDWEAYQIFVNWCVAEGIKTISDLEGRVITTDQYKALWLDRCKVVYEKQVNDS